VSEFTKAIAEQAMREVLTIPCPRCGAEPGVECPGTREGIHSARHSATPAVRAWDLAEERDRLRKAAVGGDIVAMVELGVLLATRREVADLPAARAWL
jgi:hypothetical protein